MADMEALCPAYAPFFGFAGGAMAMILSGARRRLRQPNRCRDVH